jgi:hypothetical protein
MARHWLLKGESMENRNKIHYNKDGWVCNRYPRDLPIDDEDRFLEVSRETFMTTLGTRSHFAWRVVDGQLVEEQYEDIPEEETLEELRAQREEECFLVINRGQPWHALLTEEERAELMAWYQAWLKVTETKEVPPMPEFLKERREESDDQDNASGEQAEPDTDSEPL